MTRYVWRALACTLAATLGSLVVFAEDKTPGLARPGDKDRPPVVTETRTNEVALSPPVVPADLPPAPPPALPPAGVQAAAPQIDPPVPPTPPQTVEPPVAAPPVAVMPPPVMQPVPPPVAVVPPPVTSPPPVAVAPPLPPVPMVPPPAQPVMPVSASVPAPAPKAMACPYRVSVRMGTGLPRFEIRHGDEVILKGTCERIEAGAAPDGQITLVGLVATGKVKLSGPTIDGTCESLTILSAKGELLMKGGVHLKCKKGKTTTDLAAPEIVYSLVNSSASAGKASAAGTVVPASYDSRVR